MSRWTRTMTRSGVDARGRGLLHEGEGGQGPRRAEEDERLRRRRERRGPVPHPHGRGVVGRLLRSVGRRSLRGWPSTGAPPLRLGQGGSTEGTVLFLVCRGPVFPVESCGTSLIISRTRSCRLRRARELGSPQSSVRVGAGLTGTKQSVMLMISNAEYSALGGGLRCENR